MEDYAWVILGAISGSHIKYFADEESARKYCVNKTVSRQFEWGFEVDDRPNSDDEYTINGKPFIKVRYMSTVPPEEAVEEE